MSKRGNLNRDDPGFPAWLCLSISEMLPQGSNVCLPSLLDIVSLAGTARNNQIF